MATNDVLLEYEEIDFDEDIEVVGEENSSDDDVFDWDNSEFDQFDNDEADSIPLIVFINEEGVPNICSNHDDDVVTSTTTNPNTAATTEKNSKKRQAKGKGKG